ncbi:MAG: biotin--[acetyl-CoA-carboxylase] ligase [Treponema sp.]|nr:biotin--[acetyl-CoA-carboxylase] ligase [Treponema sp.]
MVTLKIHNPYKSPVYHIKTASSTMDISKKLADDGALHGTVITADFQEAGRGRKHDRIWEMEREENLPFTILLRYKYMEDIPPALTLRTGLAVLSAIEDFSPQLKGSVMLKWPNDIMIGSKKAAGILCEAANGNVHIGIGINVAQKTFPQHLNEKATSIALAAGSNNEVSDRFDLLEKILLELYNEFERPQEESWKLRIEKRLYKKGEYVLFTEGAADSGRDVRGKLAGITDSGELLIVPEGESMPQSFISGELRFDI